MKMYEALLHAQKAINSRTEIGEILEEILDSVQELFNFEQCAVILVKQGVLRIAAARGYDETVVASWSGRIGEGITGTAALGETEYVADVRSDPRYVQGVAGAVSELAVPILFDGDILGVLDAESTRVLTAEDREWFTLFAGQIAIALRNSALLEKEKEKAAQLKALASISSRMNRGATTDALIEDILDTAGKILRYDRSAVLLYKTTHLEILASRGYDSAIHKGFRIPIGSGITGEVALKRKGVCVGDVRTAKSYIKASEDSVSEMAVPLFCNDELVGVLDADSSTRNFDDDDYFIFSAFAEQVASVLNTEKLIGEIEQKNALLVRQIEDISRINRELKKTGEALEKANHDLKKRIEELATLYEVGKTITSSLDLNETLKTILYMTGHILDVSAGAIILLDEDALEMRVQASYHTDENHNMVIESQPPQGGISEGESKVIDIPLQIGERLIGKFRFAQRGDIIFTDTERNMLVTLASQAAIAIENARLYENTQKAYYETIRSLAQALEARDSYTRGHSERVTEYSLMLAKRAGVSRKQLDILQYAGLLHDIGKIGVADAILLKPAMLSDDDFSIIKDHTQLGDAILAPLRFLNEAQDVVKYHHERWDGTGYPSGLAEIGRAHV